MIWFGLIWLRRGTSGGLFCSQVLIWGCILATLPFGLLFQILGYVINRLVSFVRPLNKHFNIK
jgi:hypothetical protein